MESTNRRDDKLECSNKTDHMFCTQLFSWTPIIIGALLAVGLGFLLDLFAKGIGLTLYTNEVDGATKLAIGGFLGLIVGGVATMFAAGFAAGFFAGPTCGKRNYGAVYGLVAWCLSLLLVALFTSNVMSRSNFIESHNFNHTAQEITNTATSVTSKLHPATDNTDTQTEKKARATGMATLALFIIFFLGALSAIFGGYFGFCYWDKWDEEYRRP